MVYTSPNGWKDRMADTTAIADAGYTVLWVAHWGVAAPTLPANDWQGNGWTIWQYSNCGDVPGIDGCVDLDWFDGLDFAPILHPVPGHGGAGRDDRHADGRGGPATVSFSEIVRGVSAESLSLRRASSGVPVDATITCASKAGDQVGCADGKSIVAVLEPAEPLVPGQSYQAIVNPAGTVAPIVDRGGNPAATTRGGLRRSDPGGTGEPGDPVRLAHRVVVTRVRPVVRDGPCGGRDGVVRVQGEDRDVVHRHRAGAGKASVWIDGHAKGTFNQYAPSTTFKVARSFRHLARRRTHDHDPCAWREGREDGRGHTGRGRCFRGRRQGRWSPELAFGWGKAKNAAASGGDVAMSDLAGSTATFAFYGTGVDWQTDARAASGPRRRSSSTACSARPWTTTRAIRTTAVRSIARPPARGA